MGGRQVTVSTQAVITKGGRVRLELFATVAPTAVTMMARLGETDFINVVGWPPPDETEDMTKRQTQLSSRNVSDETSSPTFKGYTEVGQSGTTMPELLLDIA